MVNKHGNIGSTFLVSNLAIEHKIAKLKTANVLAHTHTTSLRQDMQPPN